MKKMLLVLGIILVGCAKKEEGPPEDSDSKMQVVKIAERAYADGQRDAMEGVIRIEIVNDSQIIFTKSPWDECSDESKYFKCDVRFYDTIKTSKKD
jgi:hypothetical protein